MSVDPLAEKYPAWSPYNYVMNNPVNLIDPTGMGVEDIIFKTYNTTTKTYDVALIIESKIVNEVFEINLPLNMKDVVTGSTNLFPTKVIKDFDSYLNTFGMPDAIKLTFTADGSGGIGLSTSFDLVGFLNGTDSGNIFAYVPDISFPFSFTAGMGAGISAEIGFVFDHGSLSNFNKYSFQGKEISISGSIGNRSASMFMADDLSYRGLTIGYGYGTPYSGQGTLWAPDYKLLEFSNITNE